ncbi:MAG: DUF5659 domain-containing protein [bacterium]
MEKRQEKGFVQMPGQRQDRISEKVQNYASKTDGIVFNPIKVPQSFKIFETTDIGLAAFLKCSGLEIKKAAQHKGRIIFSFIDDPLRKDLVYKYFNSQGIVDALSFKNVLRNLKAMINNV